MDTEKYEIRRNNNQKKKFKRNVNIGEKKNEKKWTQRNVKYGGKKKDTEK